MSSITEVLLAAQSADYATRTAAEANLKNAEANNKAQYFGELTNELTTEGKPRESRTLAGLMLKNSLDAKDESRRSLLQREWVEKVPVEVRTEVKSRLLACLGSAEANAGHTSAQVIAKIAAIELPTNSWPELLPALIHNVNDANSGDHVKKAACEAIGYTCEEVEAEVLHHSSNEILTAVVNAMRSNSVPIKLAAIEALNNALEFVRQNMAVETERNYIMQCILEAANNTDNIKIRVAAYQALCTCSSLYYEYMAAYMQVIFTLTLGDNGSLFTGDDDIKLQAIEFWCTIADEESELNQEARELPAGEKPERASQNYIGSALTHLMPKLLMVMTTQEEEDDGEYTPPSAAANCLCIIAECMGDEIIAHVMPFIHSNISNQDWHYREAATMAFGSILDGPASASLQQYIEGGLGFLVQALGDPVVAVRDTTAWCLGRLSESHADIISTGNSVTHLMQTLTKSCEDQPRVAQQATWAIYKLAEAVGRNTDDSSNTNSMSPCFAATLEKLLATTMRTDAEERANDLRRNAYEAVGAMIEHAAIDVLNIVEQSIEVLTQRLEQTFMMQIVSNDDKEAQSELQGLLCGALQQILIKLDKVKVAPYCDRMMTCFLTVFSCKSSEVHEEAMMAVGAVANKIEGDFLRYMDQFMPVLLSGLQNIEHYHVCSLSVGVVGDIARALEGNVAQYCDPIVQQLYLNLQNEFLDSHVKPPILAAFGDIALAIGGNFEKYMASVMPVMISAGTTVTIVEPDNYDMVELVCTLRENLFEGFTGIIQGLKDGGKHEMFLQYVDQVLLIINMVAFDTQKLDSEDCMEVLRACIGVIGDICSTLGNKVANSIREMQAPLETLFKCASESDDSGVADITKWARKQVMNVLK